MGIPARLIFLIKTLYDPNTDKVKVEGEPIECFNFIKGDQILRHAGQHIFQKDSEKYCRELGGRKNQQLYPNLKNN